MSFVKRWQTAKQDQEGKKDITHYLHNITALTHSRMTSLSDVHLVPRRRTHAPKTQIIHAVNHRQMHLWARSYPDDIHSRALVQFVRQNITTLTFFVRYFPRRDSETSVCTCTAFVGQGARVDRYRALDDL